MDLRLIMRIAEEIVGPPRGSFIFQFRPAAEFRPDQKRMRVCRGVPCDRFGNR
jgi:hypothetical protein